MPRQQTRKDKLLDRTSAALASLTLLMASCSALPPILATNALEAPRDERTLLHCFRGGQNSVLVMLWKHRSTSSSLTGVDALGIKQFQATLNDTTPSISGVAAPRQVRDLLLLTQMRHWSEPAWSNALQNTGWQMQHDGSNKTLSCGVQTWWVGEAEGRYQFLRTRGDRTLVSCTGKLLSHPTADPR